jgi:hypothetical protein
MKRATGLAVTTVAIVLAGVGGKLWSQERPSTAPAVLTESKALEQEFREKTAILGGNRSFEDDVLTIRLPRADIWVQNDMGEIPTAAGIESSIYFYRCTCGKDRVVGQLAVADFEVNRVIDAMRSGQIDVVSVGAMFNGDKPRMMALRFQGEGDSGQIAETLKDALKRMDTKN